MEMNLLVVVGVLTLFCPAPINSFYFHTNHTVIKCFSEEIPDDTLVIGMFRVEPWHVGLGKFSNDTYGQGLKVNIEDPQWRPVLSKVFGADGRFAFTSHTPGAHRICLSSNTTASDLIFFTTPISVTEDPTRYRNTLQNDEGKEGDLRIHLRLNVGRHAVDYDVVKQKEKLTSVQLRIRKLLDLAEQIVKEQEYQRLREDRFRQTSDSTNSRVFWWSLIQFMILVGMGYWQVSNLRMFFIMKKLV
ncbi:Transmembrane emp24 domain-containing protein 4 [Orchesella cincta]|uniref:Transmembrane emp24 domain-containing protein 4 n=1 Tax=Orchesella cincta TaxID=48709 RepID=A0A1D2N0U0_ORCCI|nr:Transmembrane emp24 domain-containing protein 4 [Orchesella cincta]